MSDGISELSEVQKRCLMLVASNRTSKEIALEVGLSPQTVDQYISRAIAVLGAVNRRDAARMLLTHDGPTGFNKSEFKSEAIAPPSIPSETEPSQHLPESTGSAPTTSVLRWIINRFGGPPHDLNKLQTLRAILWTALCAAGVLAGIITIGAWLGYRAP